jgi:hypothetical protein
VRSIGAAIVSIFDEALRSRRFSDLMPGSRNPAIQPIADADRIRVGKCVETSGAIPARALPVFSCSTLKASLANNRCTAALVNARAPFRSPFWGRQRSGDIIRAMSMRGGDVGARC